MLTSDLSSFRLSIEGVRIMVRPVVNEPVAVEPAVTVTVSGPVIADRKFQASVATSPDEGETRPQPFASQSPEEATYEASDEWERPPPRWTYREHSESGGMAFVWTEIENDRAEDVGRGWAGFGKKGCHGTRPWKVPSTRYSTKAKEELVKMYPAQDCPAHKSPSSLPNPKRGPKMKPQPCCRRLTSAKPGLGGTKPLVELRPAPSEAVAGILATVPFEPLPPPLVPLPSETSRSTPLHSTPSYSASEPLLEMVTCKPHAIQFRMPSGAAAAHTSDAAAGASHRS